MWNIVPFMEQTLTLREAREAKDLSLAALAEQVGCSKSTLSRWENGFCDPSWSTVQELERVLGVKLKFTRHSSPVQAA